MLAVLTFLGGIGLFLLGMRMMTDGLKVASGNRLRDVLVMATRSRIRGLVSGVAITTLVQSSSAVIFATIGFVNAGLMTLTQAIGIIYGSNLGTTLTSWIVAVIGFNVDLRSLALPGIGIGMGLWVLLGNRRQGALGQAIAGLGIFFLGIDILREAFAGAADPELLDNLADYGNWTVILFVALGFGLTVLTQSSSAALAVTLTAAGGGLIPLPSAAAMVIGANVGTTSTALFAIIGATSSAKKAALAHVAFNVVTAVVAIVTLPLLLWLTTTIVSATGLAHQPAILLAVFHTITKLLGITLMWPITGQLVRFLDRYFRESARSAGTPRHLDHNVQQTATLALDALDLELQEMGKQTRSSARDALSREYPGAQTFQATAEAMDRLNLEISEFASGIHRQQNSNLLSQTLPYALRVAQHYVEVAYHAVEFDNLSQKVHFEHDDTAATFNDIKAKAIALIGYVEAGDPEDMETRAKQFEHEYQQAKQSLLRSGASGHLRATTLTHATETLSALHGIVKHCVKAERYLNTYRALYHNGDTRQETPEKPERA